ncbi:ankyrin repeat domain-containing protein [Clostridium ihumii]|uniref:ankyrin repeat domain-containing protein n=1 Tax=Clostridium ihumii TaxID=1470356 RepID=UPI003D33BE7D
MEVDIICLCIMIPINGLLAILPANVAKRKGKEFRTWYIYGFFLWIVAMLHAISLPEEKNINYNTNLNSNISNNNVVKKPEYKIVSSNSLEGIFDLNSPVEVLRYEILSKDNESIYFNISFRNLNQGVISAIILELQGFNSFNELIKVDGNDKFTCCIQDLNGQLGSSFKNMYPVLLPEKDIRKLDITIKEVSFNEGKFIYKNEANKIEVEVENIKEEDEFKALRKHTQDGICYAKECNNLWVCVCGRPNHENVRKCVRCGLDKEYVFTALSREQILEEIKEEKRIEEEEEKERVLREQELEEKQKEHQEKQRKVRKKHMIFGSFITIGIIVGIVGLVDISQYKNKPLSYFIIEGDVRKIKNSIKFGADINGIYGDGEKLFGETPLNIAVKEKNIEVVKLLIELGADVNKKDNYAETPFQIADRLKEKEIVDILVENGSNGLKEKEQEKKDEEAKRQQEIEKQKQLEAEQVEQTRQQQEIIQQANDKPTHLSREEVQSIVNELGEYCKIYAEGPITSDDYNIDERLYGHYCYYIGTGGNGLAFVIDGDTGKVYESLGKGEDFRRKLRLYK